MSARSLKYIFAIMILVLFMVNIHAQGTPHAILFHIYHADGTTAHSVDNLGFKVTNTSTGTNMNGPYYYNYPAQINTEGIAIYDKDTAVLSVFAGNFFADCAPAEIFTFEFVGDYGSELVVQVARSESSVTNGGKVEFGSISIPQNMQIAYSESNVLISWDQVQGAVLYRIERSDFPYSGFEVLDSVEHNSFSDSLNMLNKFYRIIAIDQ